jgi:hypothetical protein
MGKSSLLSVDMKMVYAGGTGILKLARNSLKLLPDTTGIMQRKKATLITSDLTQCNFPPQQEDDKSWALDLQNITNHRNILVQNWMQNWNNDSKGISTSYQMAFMPMMTYW